MSPGLAELLATPDGRALAPRLPGRVAGEIDPSALVGPADRQVFLTAPRAEELPRELNLEVWRMTDGRVRGPVG